MTKEEKIGILWRMMGLNFIKNFNRKGLCVGLCTIYEIVTDFRLFNLKDNIPELIQYRNHYCLAYWWPYTGRFIPWWERHKAIWKTIRNLSKS